MAKLRVYDFKTVFKNPVKYFDSQCLWVSAENNADINQSNNQSIIWQP